MDRLAVLVGGLMAGALLAVTLSVVASPNPIIVQPDTSAVGPDGVLSGNLIAPSGQKICVKSDCSQFVYSDGTYLTLSGDSGSHKIQISNQASVNMSWTNTDNNKIGIGTNYRYYFQYPPGGGYMHLVNGVGTLLHAVDTENTVYFDHQIVVTGVSAASPNEPFACDADHFGAIIPADDTDDTSWSGICTCANLDGTGYDWRDASDVTGTACPFF